MFLIYYIFLYFLKIIKLKKKKIDIKFKIKVLYKKFKKLNMNDNFINILLIELLFQILFI